MAPVGALAARGPGALLGWALAAAAAYRLLAALHFAAVGRRRAIAARLLGKVALVTGGGNGLGRLLVMRLVACGCLRKLIVWDLDKAGMEQTKSMADALNTGTVVEVASVDVVKRRAVFSQAQAVVERGDTPDVLILNAGVVRGNEFLEEKSEDAIRAVFDVNVLHLFWMCQAFLPSMSEKKHFNRIVTVGSAAGMSGSARLVDYCSSKFAAVGFADSLRAELRKRGLSTTSSVVNPYVIDTGMFRGATGFNCLLPLLRPEDVVRAIIDCCILGDTAVLCMPRFIYLVPLLKALLPSWLQDSVAQRLGVMEMMDRFVGRRAKPPGQSPRLRKACERPGWRFVASSPRADPLISA